MEGTILAVTEKSEGEYQVSQVGSQDRVPKIPEGNDNVKTFQFSLGPATVRQLWSDCTDQH